MERTLIFSVAINNYSNAFRRCIESQHRYATQHGYDYLCVEDVGGGADLGNSGAWLKIPLILGALSNGYTNVVFIDADIEVTEGASDIVAEMTSRSSKSIFCALGHSGRINSGVIGARNTSDAVKSLSRILSRAGTYLPPTSAVSWWGENGHVIYELSNNSIFGKLDTYWNNTYDLNSREGFIHYTGPMRSLYVFSETEMQAWEEIRKNRFSDAGLQSIDRIDFYRRILDAYQELEQRHPYFAPFSSDWINAELLLGNHQTSQRSRISTHSEHRDLRVHFCHDYDPTTGSTNPYIDELTSGIASIIGADNLIYGHEFFWSGDYSNVDAIHIQWIEVLCSWNKPTEEVIANIAARLAEIKKTTKIVYTLHNIELKADFGEMGERLMGVINSYADVIVHLSEASISAFHERYAGLTSGRALHSTVVPHGTYDGYFDYAAPAENADIIRNHIFICGAIRTQKEWDLAQAVAEAASSAGYPVAFAGNVASSVLHWKEKRRLEDLSSKDIYRNHSRVETEELVALAHTARCFFLPRQQRLNSGVWYLAATFGCPAIAPDEMSMQQLQQEVGGLCYKTGDANSAFNQVVKAFEMPLAERINLRSRLLKYAQSNLQWHTICRKHVDIYEGKIEKGSAI